MKLTPVTSSNVVAVGYRPDRRQLFIQFKDGLYRYDAVPPNIYSSLLAAESVGKFVASIRFKFPYTKLDRLLDELTVVVVEDVSAQEELRAS